MADPVRLRDERSSATRELRELLAAGRSEVPDPERLRGVAGRLGYPASAVPSAKLLAKAGAGGGAFAGATKIGALVLLVGAGAGVLAMRDRATVAATPVVLPATTSAAEPTPPTTTTTTTATDIASSPEPPSMAPSLPKPGPRGGAVSRSVIAAVPPHATSAPAAQDTQAPPTPGAPATWGSSAPLKPDAPEEPSAPAPLAPIPEAQRELAANPSHALYLALRDQRVAGDLVEERELVIIQALLRLGRRDEAREHAARFLRLFPASTHRDEVAAPFGFDPGAQNP